MAREVMGVLDPATTGGGVDASLTRAKVQVELGWLDDAEDQVAKVLDADPENLSALSLYAKIKHMRGELSQAIGCWAQIHMRSPHKEVALMNLRAILQLAEDPERGAGEFVALGPYQLARKPAAQLELEEAFRAFLARHPEEARSRCVQIAQKHQGQDRETYKLAVMAGAWIAELSGDVAGACAILERLGEERGFQIDTDRVLALMRLYEAWGSPEKLSSAINIAKHLDRRFVKMSLLSRMSVLYGRLGQQDLSADYRNRYAAAFRQRMHRPTFAEAVQATATGYLPLDRVRAIPFPDRQLPPKPGPREEACAAALAGDTATARRLFPGGAGSSQRPADPLDMKYVADLARIDGDAERAADFYLQALEPGAEDPYVLAHLLDGDAVGRSAAALERLRHPDLSVAIGHRLETALKARPLSATLWRQHARVDEQAGRSAHEERCPERARALEQARQERDHPIGRVLAAGVYHFIGKAKGLIHEVWAGREPAPDGAGGNLPPESILANLTPEMKLGVRNTFLAVREYARTKLPHRTADLFSFNYTYKVTKEDEPSGGLSAGLPTALAFLSVFLRRSVPQDVCSSGVVVSDAHDVLTVRRVGDAELKLKAAYHRNLRMLVLPLENQPALVQDTVVPSAIRDEIVRYVVNLDEAVRLVFGDDVFM
jgi:tetratricopeptide (TPR) repeat protein